MDRGVPAPRYAYQIAIQYSLARADSAGKRRDARFTHMTPSQHLHDAVTKPHINRVSKQTCPGHPVLRTAVDDHDARAGRIEVPRRSIRIIVVDENHGLAARQHGELIDVVPRRACQHHAWAVVSVEHQRALDRTGRAHELPGLYRPMALPREVTGAWAQMVGHALDRAEGQPIVLPEHSRAAEQLHVFPGGEALPQSGRPVCSRLSIDLNCFAGKVASGRGPIIDEKDARARPRRGVSRHQPGRPRPHNKDVAMGMGKLVAIRVWLVRKRAEPGRAPVRHGRRRGVKDCSWRDRVAVVITHIRHLSATPTALQVMWDMTAQEHAEYSRCH